MSDVTFAAVDKKKKLLDIIDEAWLKDTLSDDEIEVPVDAFVHEEDEDESEPGIVAEDVWDHIGLDRFIAEQNSGAISQNQAIPATVSQPQQTTS